MKRLSIFNAAQILTLRGPARPRVGPELCELGIIENGGVIINGGVIELIGTSDEIKIATHQDDEIIDASGRVVLPGFVDAHTHPVFGGNRVDEYELRAKGETYERIAASGGGISSTVRRTRDASNSELLDSSMKHANWFLSGGTTTIEAKSGYGLNHDDEIRQLDVIRRLDLETPLRLIPTFLGAHSIPVEFRNRRSEYIEFLINEMLPLVASANLARYCDVFCERNVFSIKESRAILSKAKKLGLSLRIHADQLSLNGGAQLAAEIGATTADHLENTDRAGIAALKHAGVQPVLLPASVYSLGSANYPDARGMIDAGLAVVLATDFNPGSSPTTSMQMVLSLASTHMKVSPAEAISAATINAACSLGLGHVTGSIESSKSADIVIYDCPDYREIAYYFGITHTHIVIAGGEVAFSRQTGTGIPQYSV